MCISAKPVFLEFPLLCYWFSREEEEIVCVFPSLSVVLRDFVVALLRVLGNYAECIIIQRSVSGDWFRAVRVGSVERGR